MVKKCSDRPEQVFFSVFTSMEMATQQLVSVAGDGLVPVSQLTRCLVATSVVNAELCSSTKRPSCSRLILREDSLQKMIRAAWPWRTAR